MSTEHTLSPKESLDLITETIGKTKENLKEHSFLFLLWGWLIAIASILHFLLIHTSFPYYFIGWPVLAGSGIGITLLHLSKKMKTAATETYFSFFLNRMWLVLGACFILTVTVSLLQHLMPFTYTLLIAGMGTTVSGLILRFKPLLLGGFFFLASSLWSVFLPTEYKILLHAVAIVMGYLLPGYLLKSTK